MTAIRLFTNTPFLRVNGAFLATSAHAHALSATLPKADRQPWPSAQHTPPPAREARRL